MLFTIVYIYIVYIYIMYYVYRNLDFEKVIKLLKSQFYFFHQQVSRVNVLFFSFSVLSCPDGHCRLL